ncbi:MAG: DUF167 domain-containing protein [Bryobacteraceae bacterium]|jgi:uncharacterized protein YggU (UPF0235/DUF167 family)
MAKARLTLKIRAGARKTAFAGRFGESWKLHVAAPPVDGKANEAILRFLARLACVPATAVRIVSGFTGTTKIVEIVGIDSDTLQRAILESHGDPSNPGSAAAPTA